MATRQRHSETGFLRTILNVENIELNRFRITATVLDGLDSAGVSQNMRRYRLGSPYQALADEILLKFVRFRKKCLSDTANTAILQWSKSAETKFTFFKLALPDALILNTQKQTLIFGKLKLVQQSRHEQGQRIDTGKRHASAFDGI